MRNIISILGILALGLTVALSCALSLAQTVPVNVTTWHNDIGRTGQNTNESTLTTTLVGDDTKFGKLCSTSLDGFVYAQPLVVTNVLFSGQNTAKTVVYVVTMNDTVYAIDGTTITSTNCTVLRQKALFPTGSGEVAAGTGQVGGGNTLGPKIGVLGTPVIVLNAGSPTTGTLYVVAESVLQSGPTYYHRLWALDITSLASVDSGPTVICSNTSSCGGQSSNAFSQVHIQRPGLLCLGANTSTCPTSPTNNNAYVYVAFSMIDGAANNPNGWIFGYNVADLSQTPLSFETTPETAAIRGGIWQGGGGLAAGIDSSGGSTYIYFSTGDGDFDLPGGTNASDSFIKLATNLTIPGTLGYTSSNFFTPSDQCYRESADVDFGSGGVMLLPDNLVTSNPYLAIKADKENYFWVVDRGTPGGFNAGGCTNSNCSPGSHVQPCKFVDWANQNLQALQINTGHNTHTTPAFWGGNTTSNRKGWLFFAADSDLLKGYPVDPTCAPNGVGVVCPATLMSAMDLGYSATPSVSSNSASNGIVWAIKNVTSGVGLYAFDATSLNELYDTNKCVQIAVHPDAPGNPTRFSVPTVANGFVYIGTETDFDIYGQLPQQRICNIQQ